MIDCSKIIILILSTKNPEYQDFKIAIEKTYLQDFKSLGLKCFFYEGGSETNKIQGNTITVRSQDGLYDVSNKLVETLKFVFELYPDTELIYRTNLSSYIDVETFMNFLEFQNLNLDTYAGVIGSTYLVKERHYKHKILYFLLQFLPFGKRVQFASGAGFFLGANHCRKIISSKVNLSLVDDIMVAHTIKVIPSFTAIPERIAVSKKTKHQFQKESFLKLVNDKHLFHYRFKTKNRKEDATLLRMFGDKNYRESFFISTN
jgi:hypothetical protein